MPWRPRCVTALLLCFSAGSTLAFDWSTLDPHRGTQRCRVTGCGSSGGAIHDRSEGEFRESREREIVEQSDRAWDALDNDRWVEAEAQFRRVVAMRAGPWAYHGLGFSLLRQGRLNEAERAFRNSEEASRRYEVWRSDVWRTGLEYLYMARANESTKAGDIDQSVRHLLDAVGINPKTENGAFLWGRIGGQLWAGSKHPREALVAMKKALSLDPRDEKLREMNRLVVEAVQHHVENIQSIAAQSRQNYNSQLQKLMNEADRIVVPAPVTSRRIHEAVILGLGIGRGDVATTEYVSPFSRRPYAANAVFDFQQHGTLAELYRGLRDSQTGGEYSLETPVGRRLIEELNGARIARLLAHSNGASVAEALIRAGHIKVDELNIVGGDRSLVNHIGYRELLASGKVKRIVVWINPGDPIPVGSSRYFPVIRHELLEVEPAARWIASIVLGAGLGGDSGVEYRILAGRAYRKGQEAEMMSHYLPTYLENIEIALR